MRELGFRLVVFRLGEGFKFVCVDFRCWIYVVELFGKVIKSF